jgi:hypothetical protein
MPRLVKYISSFALSSVLFGGLVFADDAWKNSFDEICSKIQTADNLSVQELTALMEKTDKLQPEIQASNDPSKKIYLQRLKKCRSFFQFMIDSK